MSNTFLTKTQWVPTTQSEPKRWTEALGGRWELRPFKSIYQTLHTCTPIWQRNAGDVALPTRAQRQINRFRNYSSVLIYMHFFARERIAARPQTVLKTPPRYKRNNVCRCARKSNCLSSVCVCQLVVLCLCILFLYHFLNKFIFIFVRAAVSAFKPFCPAHNVLRNIYICSLYCQQ